MNGIVIGLCIAIVALCSMLIERSHNQLSKSIDMMNFEIWKLELKTRDMEEHLAASRKASKGGEETGE